MFTGFLILDFLIARVVLTHTLNTDQNVTCKDVRHREYLRASMFHYGALHSYIDEMQGLHALRHVMFSERRAQLRRLISSTSAAC